MFFIGFVLIRIYVQCILCVFLRKKRQGLQNYNGDVSWAPFVCGRQFSSIIAYSAFCCLRVGIYFALLCRMLGTTLASKATAAGLSLTQPQSYNESLWLKRAVRCLYCSVQPLCRSVCTQPQLFRWCFSPSRWICPDNERYCSHRCRPGYCQVLRIGLAAERLPYAAIVRREPNNTWTKWKLCCFLVYGLREDTTQNLCVYRRKRFTQVFM